jgi:hypothetical protein
MTACNLLAGFTLTGTPLRRLLSRPCVAAAAAVALTACETSKSANPLSPTVAGPIPGVNITAPTPIDPNGGARITVDQQPLTLMIGNASSSGVRPLSYLFEVATDVDFNSKVFTRDGIAPGDGRTSLRLPDPLATGRTYYWRSKAQDGANAGPYSAMAYFNVFTPVVIGAPVPVSPIGNVQVDVLHPRFTVTDAPRSGPVGSVTYVIELSDTDTFSNRIAIWTTAEQSNQTSLDAPADLSYSTQYFWHARAYDTVTTGPWSTTQVFQTPVLQPTPTPAPPPGPPPPTGPVPPDEIAMSQASVFNSPAGLASWARTAAITSVTYGAGFFSVDFSKRTGPGRWPDVPFGAPGDSLQYTLGLCLNIGGRWDCSAAIEYWYGRDLGASSAIARDWFYDSRWGPMAGYQPSQGELIGIFVGAGNLRNVTDHSGSLVLERSNVLVVPWGQNYAASRLPGGATELSVPRPIVPGVIKPFGPRPPLKVIPPRR